MSGMEDMINNILGDKESMEKIKNMASQLFGGESGGEKVPEKAPPMPQLDPAMLGKLGSMMSAAGNDDKAGLLKAISPYLAPARREKLGRAMMLARMARVAGAAFGEGGGDGNKPL